MDRKRMYQKELDAIIEALKPEEPAPHLLLHSCCGPCSSYVLSYLAPYFQVSILYQNSNIHPQEEFEHRYRELLKVVEQVDFPHGVQVIKGTYAPNEYFEAVKGVEHLGEGSERCFRCYDFRLKQAAEWAHRIGADYMCSTLSVSPYKNAARLNALGEARGAEMGVRHLPNDFKKNGGYQKSIAYCKAWHIDRQHYCGCVFSRHEWAMREKEKALVASLEREATVEDR